MKSVSYGLLVGTFLGVALGEFCQRPASGDYLTDVRIIETEKQSLQAYVTEGDGSTQRCVKMKTNRNANIFEMECCDVCYLLTDWLDGFADQYVDKLKVMLDDDGKQVLEFEYDDPDSDDPITHFYQLDYDTKREYVNPDHYFYFSAPFTIDQRSDETENIYVFTTDSAGGQKVNRVLNLHYDDGIGGAATVRSGYTDLTDTSKYAARVFDDWDMSMSGSRLGCFSEPFIGYSIPIKADTGKSCFNNATVQYIVDDSNGQMTMMDILDYDMFVAPADGEHNARGISWHEFENEVRVYYTNQDPLTFTYEADKVHLLDTDEKICDYYNIPTGDQC